MRKHTYFFFVLLFIFSCSSEDKHVKVKEAEEKKIDLKVVRLEEQLFNLKNKQEARQLLLANPSLVKDYLGLPYPIQDSQFVDIFYDFYTNPDLKKFYQKSTKEFGDFSDVKTSLTELFKYTTYYYPKYKVPEVQTIITGFRFDKDISFSDDTIIISYDYFLGPKSEFKPPLYDYFLERYQKPYLSPMIAQAISARFNNSNMDDKSMLASMIYYGKAHYFTERVMPSLQDTLNIMYTGTQLADVEKHIDVIWGHFIEKQLLFDKTKFQVDKYCGERPVISEIGEKCPGRIGRWLGWQIVRSYMKENPNVTLQQLMEDNDAMKIFKASKYKPGKS